MLPQTVYHPSCHTTSRIIIIIKIMRRDSAIKKSTNNEEVLEKGICIVSRDLCHLQVLCKQLTLYLTRGS